MATTLSMLTAYFPRKPFGTAQKKVLAEGRTNISFLLPVALVPGKQLQGP